MALVTIVAVNQTGGDIPLSQLYAPNSKIPASGSANLTDYNRVEEILGDKQLLNLLQTDYVLLTLNGAPLTKAQSLAFLDAPTTPVKHSRGESSQGPTADDDETLGFSIGSVWITTSDVVYTCTDAATGAASWATSTTIPWGSPSNLIVVTEDYTVGVPQFVFADCRNNRIDVTMTSALTASKGYYVMHVEDRTGTAYPLRVYAPDGEYIYMNGQFLDYIESRRGGTSFPLVPVADLSAWVVV